MFLMELASGVGRTPPSARAPTPCGFTSFAAKMNLRPTNRFLSLIRSIRFHSGRFSLIHSVTPGR